VRLLWREGGSGRSSSARGLDGIEKKHTAGVLHNKRSLTHGFLPPVSTLKV
jgi:hypothetical protein